MLPQLVGQYFKILEEAENDAVLSSLQSIVDVFGVEIRPLALDMLEHLLAAFRHFSGLATDSEESTFSATQALDTVLAVLDVSPCPTLPYLTLTYPTLPYPSLPYLTWPV